MDDDKLSEILVALERIKTTQALESVSNKEAHDSINKSIGELYDSRNATGQQVAVIEFKAGQMWGAWIWLIVFAIESAFAGAMAGWFAGKN